MRILIISYFFSPDNEIGAVRPTKFAKYLSNMGNDVHVVCLNKKNGTSFYKDENKVNIHRISNNNFITEREVNRENSIQNQIAREDEVEKAEIFKEINNIKRTTYELYKNYDWVNKSEKYIKENIKNIEVIFSTYGPLSTHILAERLKKKLKIKWIADFRDPILFHDESYFKKKYMKNLQKKFCRNSDYITVVSKGTGEYLLQDDFSNKNKIYQINNGFDKEDIKISNKKTNYNKKFRLVYTGTLYQGKRDLSIVFKAIKRLNIIDIELIYAGKEFGYLRRQAMKYGVEKILINKGYVDREESLALQQSADILLLVTWNESRHQGVIPGKFYEYMLFERPIVAIVNGTICNSELKKIINECNNGICCEEGSNENNVFLIEKFLRENYKQDSHERFNEIEIEKYSYENLTTKLYELMSK